MILKNKYCSYCGYEFKNDEWPRTCEICTNISYINPLPVVAVIVPTTSKKILVVRRGEAPGKGKLALPGGYLDVDETWQEGAARELAEETGIIVLSTEIKLLSVSSSLVHNTLLVFCHTNILDESFMFEKFKPNHEVLELVAIDRPYQLAFPTHTDSVKTFFDKNF